MSKTVKAVLVVLLFIPFIAKSQIRSELLFKEQNPLSIWVAPRVQFYTPNQSFLFYQGTAYIDKKFPIGHSFPLNSISEINNALGYEHKASDKWYLGVSGKLNSRFGRTTPSYRVNITHIGEIKSFRFFQEVALQYIDNPKSDNPNIIISDVGIVSLNLMLVKRFQVKESNVLDAYLGYKPCIYFDYVNDGFTAYDTRKIDYTIGYAGINVSVANTLMVGIFAARATQYYYRIETTGPNGVTKAGKVNAITPLLGLNLTYLFKINRENPEEFPYYYFKF